MADLQTIREALAGNLAALRDVEVAPNQPLIGQVSAYMLDNPTPPAVLVAGVDSEGMDFHTYGREDVIWTILVEACLGLVTDIGAQKLLNKLLAPTGETSLVATVEATPTLTKRLSDQGVVTTGQTAAAQNVAFAEYRGQTPFVLTNGSRVLLATWAFTVIA